ncbi:MAG: Hsp70 family protein [Clostridiales bacterium]|nr:Hsp70 family protein [Clostridiales bacterium]
MANKVNMPIIGFDFGNSNSLLCFLYDWNGETTRKGGIMYDLQPTGLQDGIPSVCYYSRERGFRCGENAVTTAARPVSNRQRNLKRHLSETVTLDGKTIAYADMITRVTQHCIRRANEKLQRDFQITTNQVSLAYPVTYSFAEIQRLIELVERGTLEDGRHIQVCGTIMEPAAAALDYLADKAQTDDVTTVLTYDLGGGTFDVALVAAYPDGRRDKEGHTYYYDELGKDGLPDLGGTEFDEIMYEIILSKLEAKIGAKLSDPAKERVRQNAERYKIELSSAESTFPYTIYNDDDVRCEVTRDEFESKALNLVMKTVEKTREFLKDKPQPDLILLTGGASQMPIVRKKLQEELPEQYRDKIIFFRPSKAIAYGAARYGVKEHDVKKRTAYDLGIRFFRPGTDIRYIDTYIPAGTEIPYSGEYVSSYTRSDGAISSNFSVFEATVAKPEEEQISRDWREIMYVTLEHGPVPKNTENESRLSVDERGLLTVEARDPSKPGKPPVKNAIKLKF